MGFIYDYEMNLIEVFIMHFFRNFLFLPETLHMAFRRKTSLFKNKFKNDLDNYRKKTYH